MDADNPGVQIIHRGKYKSSPITTSDCSSGVKRRQAIEPLIGHTKSDHHMDRCWLQGAAGDALHALSCGAGYNIRWPLRAIVRLGLGPLLHLLDRFACLACLLQAMPARIKVMESARTPQCPPSPNLPPSSLAVG